MSVGEYLSVFASIILGIAVADLALSLHRLLRCRSHVKWDWLSPAIAGFVLLNLTAIWWATFGWYSHAARISVVSFFPDLALFFLTVLAAAAALPDDVPPAGIDLRRFYFEQSRYFWTVQALTVAVIVVFVGPRYVAGGWLDLAAAQRDNILSLALLVLLAVTRRPWIHYLGVVALIAYTVWGYVGVSMEDISSHTISAVS